MVGTLVRGVGVHHCVTFNFGYVKLHNCAISIDIYFPVKKFYSLIIFSILTNAVILLLNYLVLIHYLYIHLLSLRSYFIYFYLDLYITDTALKVSRSLYCFTTPLIHGIENYFPILWGMGISDAILFLLLS